MTENIKQLFLFFLSVSVARTQTTFPLLQKNKK